ncbi:CASP-like protein 4A3 [Cornus florida]|uniref:CASP-like protein 4A3 n=1 Tax=Cornus florida TaxID=4283 RepID=UPI00289796CA|nr:CASP-like protein 4A3 [Cornus florida]
MEHQPKLPNSHSKKRSMSDTESQTSQADSFYSPLRSDSPFRSVGPDKWPEKSPPSKAIVAVNKYNLPVRSPTQNHRKAFAPQENLNPPAGSLPPPPPPLMVVNRAVRDEVAAGVTKVGPTMVEEGFGGDERRSRAVVASTMNRAALGFRVCEMILCLISFSVMAADKTQGWTGDSFDRYIEYRFCVAVTVIGFAYSGFQAYDLAYHLISGKHVISHHLRYHFDFLMDQILAYLLMSASSSAATRVIDWVSNWGKDEFTEMASASIGMSFLAFAAFALSSLISGYNLCNRDIA